MSPLIDRSDERIMLVNPEAFHFQAVINEPTLSQ